MRKLKSIAVAIVACLVLTGCGCEKKATTYTVTFDSNGGTAVASQKVEDGKTVTSPANPTRDGFTFDGWYLNDVKYDFSKKVTSNFTLVGKWTASSTTKDNDKKDDNKTVTPTPSNNNTPSKNTNSGTGSKTNTGSGSNSGSSSNTNKTVAVTGITLNASAVTLTAGESSTLTATIAPTNATNKAVTWSSSDTNVVTVVDGKLTAVAAGTATIYAKAGDKTATVTVTVNPAVQSYTYENVGTPAGFADVQVGIKVYDASGKEVVASELDDANGNYLGEYSSSAKLIVVNKNEVSKIAKVIISGQTYDIKQK